MKNIVLLLFAPFLFVSISISFSACDTDDYYWEIDESLLLTDESHGSLTNGHVVATGDAQNITHNSATILCSANYNYKEALSIQPGIIYSTSPYTVYDKKYKLRDGTEEKISDFTNSECKVTLENLIPSTTYYYQVFARIECEYGAYEAYGEIKSFTTTADYTAGDAVDLGLSVKWANRNIGASSPENRGYEFYWGGIVPCEDSYYQADWHDFSLSTLMNQGYIDEDYNLCPSYDAASQLWGGKWRMPTSAECQELLDKCEWKKTTKNGLSVYLVTGPNSNVIYMPDTYYWTATASSVSWASWSYYLDYNEVDFFNRGYTHSIRPVMK